MSLQGWQWKGHQIHVSKTSQILTPVNCDVGFSMPRRVWLDSVEYFGHTAFWCFLTSGSTVDWSKTYLVLFFFKVSCRFQVTFQKSSAMQQAYACHIAKEVCHVTLTTTPRNIKQVPTSCLKGHPISKHICQVGITLPKYGVFLTDKTPKHEVYHIIRSNWCYFSL